MKPMIMDWREALAAFGRFCYVAFIALVIGIALLLSRTHARDLNGRYADSPLKSWFDSLASKKGLCCSVADGVSVKDVDWDNDNGKYRVRLEGKWVDVPEEAVVTVPNRFGSAVVWPIYIEGSLVIRCFIPGALS